MRHGPFEAAVFDNPDDVDAWSVYADWLASQGDPIGELISLELSIEAAAVAGHGLSPELGARCAALAHDGPSRWASESLARLLADPDVTRSLALEWRRGQPYFVRITTDSTRAASELLDALSITPGIKFLIHLSLSFRAERDAQHCIPARVFRERPLASLRVLDIDGWTFARAHAGLVDLDFDWDAAFPRLQTLRLRSPHLVLPAMEHRRLRALTLSFRHGFEPRPIELLASARLPALDELRLFLGQLGDLSPERARVLVARVIDNPLLGGADGPRRLSLDASELPPSFYAQLADARLLRGLRDLRLAWSTIGDEYLPALRAIIANAPGLERLDLTRNYLSEAAVDELGRLFRGRLLAEDQKPDGERQLPVFGRYGVRDDLDDGDLDDHGAQP